MPLITVKTHPQGLRRRGKARDDRAAHRDDGGHRGKSMRGVTWVVIEEIKSGEWGLGGKALTTEAVREIKESVAA